MNSRTILRSCGLKSRMWLVSGILIFSIYGCEIDNTLRNLTISKGYIEAEMNGEDWRIDCTVLKDKNDENTISLVGMVFNESTRLYERFYVTFVNIPKNDTIMLYNNFVENDRSVKMSFRTIYEEMDVSHESFQLINDTANFIKLNVIGNYKKLEARFEIKLAKVLELAVGDSLMPDTLIFKSGYILTDL